jgi:glutaminyl-tRNA synthetase
VPGGEVRLRNAYVIRCDEVIEDGAGEVVELRCSVDADTLGKNPEGRKVKGVIHWVSAATASMPRCASMIGCSRPAARCRR